ncbi:hypothetical protein BofuT4_uP146830.1 [Botrytis cinerea T4]|uniref:Uncharacterized protein n=1 Tax=Botryotinia fuckeliana (strain T4) TaxID=999810 RepID=G2YY16_BOTF4|nr:hypothetical protein BofuT4_uP146830.1 [Botrytis cinerea T4]
MLDMRAMSSSSWVQKGISRGRLWSSAIEQGFSSLDVRGLPFYARYVPTRLHALEAIITTHPNVAPVYGFVVS